MIKYWFIVRHVKYCKYCKMYVMHSNNFLQLPGRMTLIIKVHLGVYMISLKKLFVTYCRDMVHDLIPAF